MLKIAMCDDNLETTLSIQKMLESEIIEQDLDAQIVCTTSSQAEISKLIKEKEIDLLILDVEFENGQKDGIEFAKELRKFNKDFYLVFLSAHQRFLYPALVTKIFDYLVKPANKEAIKEFIKRLKEEFESNTNMFVQISKWQSIRASEIIYMEKNINRTEIYTKTDTYSCTKTLDKLMEILPNNFVKCHRSYIINKDKIISIDLKEKQVILENNITCPINSNFNI